MYLEILSTSAELVIKSLSILKQTWQKPFSAHSCSDFLLKKSFVSWSVVIIEVLYTLSLGTSMSL